MVKPRTGWLCLLVSTAAAGCGQTARPAASPSEHAPAPVKPVHPALALDDGIVCPVGPRSAVDTCLAKHAFCARDVVPLKPALPDLVVVITYGAVDCAGYYLLAASGGQWAPLQELHRHGHHDPRYGDLAVVSMRDETVAGQRVTRLAYTIELVSSEIESAHGEPPPEPDESPPEPDESPPEPGGPAAEPAPEQLTLSCTWPAAGFPSCK